MSIETIIKEYDSCFTELNRGSALLLEKSQLYINLYSLISRIIVELNNGASAQQHRLNVMLGEKFKDYSYVQASVETDKLIKYVSDIVQLNENISRSTINIIKPYNQ